MRFIAKDLPISTAARRHWIKAFHTALGEDKGFRHSLLDHLYENLSVLDGKTNSLIALCSLLIATYAFLLPPTDKAPVPHRGVFSIGIFYAIISVSLCIIVIQLHWSSAHKLHNEHESLADELLRVRTTRTMWYRRALTYTRISLISLTILIFDRVIIKIPRIPITWIGATILIHHFFIYIWDKGVIYLSVEDEVMPP